MSQKPIILSDESINCYGFRVITEGISLANFYNNPVMFYNHDRSLLPIGKWVDIKKENNKLIATPFFDEKDPFALQIKSKYEQGILNAASIGINIIECSEDPALVLAGQTRPTVIKSELNEVSIADIPANKNAIKMSFASNAITLSGSISDHVLNSFMPSLASKQNSLSMVTKITKAIAVKALGLYHESLVNIIDLKSQALKKDGATEKQIETELAPLKQEAMSTYQAEQEMKAMEVFADSQEYSNKYISTKTEDFSFSELQRKHPEQLKHIALTNPAMYKRLFKEEFAYDVSDDEMIDVRLAYGGNGNIEKSTESYVSLEEKTRAIKELGDTTLMSQLAKKDPNSVKNKIDLAFPGMKESDKNEFINSMINL